MATQKCVSSKPYHNLGTSFIHYAYSSGLALDRTATAGQPRTFNPSGFNDRVDSAQPSWTNGTGTTIDVTGSVLFNNDTNGGSLASVLVSNAGSNTAYVGFNSKSMAVASGFPLASGQSMQHEGYITEVWAITNSGTTAVTALGLYNYTRLALGNG